MLKSCAIQLPRFALACDRGLQHQHHVVEQGIVGVQGGYKKRCRQSAALEKMC
jgi:hypothetical protein